jgi:hypothetical protein
MEGMAAEHASSVSSLEQQLAESQRAASELQSAKQEEQQQQPPPPPSQVDIKPIMEDIYNMT